MRPGRNGKRAGWLLGAAVAVGLLGGLPEGGPVAAQQLQSPILVLEQDRFFLESAFGRAAQERERMATAALEQENKRIEAELVAEELALTDERKTLPPDDFTTKAAAFDAKVVSIRTEQDAKAQALAEAREIERRDFLQLAGPVLAKLLVEKQAVAIIDKGRVIISASTIDVTDEAIARVDAALAASAPIDGAPTGTTPDPAPAP